MFSVMYIYLQLSEGNEKIISVHAVFTCSASIFAEGIVLFLHVTRENSRTRFTPPTARSAPSLVVNWSFQTEEQVHQALLKTLEGHQRQILGTLTVEELYKVPRPHFGAQNNLENNLEQNT